MFRLRLIHAAFAACAAFAVSTPASDANAQDVSDRAVKITIDRAKVVRIPRPADTVIIGNPGIADAVLQDARTLVLTGRSTGITNMIILDTEGDPIVDETIVVGNSEIGTVRLYSRARRQTLSCSPVCEGILANGDEQNYFNQVAGQNQTRQRLAQDGQ